MFSSTIIHDLEAHLPDCLTRNLAYWYFRFDDKRSQDVSKMLRSIIRQISSSPLYPGIRALRNRHHQAGSEPSLEELTTALGHALGTLGGDIYIVFDALDECPHLNKQGQRDQLLLCIKNLVANTSLNMHLLVTSRPEPDIRVELYSIAASLDIEELVKDDVAQYVNTALQENQRLASLNGNTKDQIKEKLLSFQERQIFFCTAIIKSVTNIIAGDSVGKICRSSVSLNVPLQKNWKLL
jgi:hypothetical protein